MYIRDHWDCNTVESMERAEVLRKDCPWVSIVTVMSKDFAYAMRGLHEEIRIEFYTANGSLRAIALPKFA